jgi:hypothetical protein
MSDKLSEGILELAMGMGAAEAAGCGRVSAARSKDEDGEEEEGRGRGGGGRRIADGGCGRPGRPLTVDRSAANRSPPASPSSGIQLKRFGTGLATSLAQAPTFFRLLSLSFFADAGALAQCVWSLPTAF